jgi:hypothetical protein
MLHWGDWGARDQRTCEFMMFSGILKIGKGKSPTHDREGSVDTGLYGFRSPLFSIPFCSVLPSALHCLRSTLTSLYWEMAFLRGLTIAFLLFVNSGLLVTWATSHAYFKTSSARSPQDHSWVWWLLGGHTRLSMWSDSWLWFIAGKGCEAKSARRQAHGNMSRGNQAQVPRVLPQGSHTG